MQRLSYLIVVLLFAYKTSSTLIHKVTILKLLLTETMRIYASPSTTDSTSELISVAYVSAVDSRSIEAQVCRLSIHWLCV